MASSDVAPALQKACRRELQSRRTGEETLDRREARRRESKSLLASERWRDWKTDRGAIGSGGGPARAVFFLLKGEGEERLSWGPGKCRDTGRGARGGSVSDTCTEAEAGGSLRREAGSLPDLTERGILPIPQRPPASSSLLVETPKKGECRRARLRRSTTGGPPPSPPSASETQKAPHSVSSALAITIYQ